MRDREANDLYCLHYIQVYCERIMEYLDVVHHDRQAFMENKIIMDAVSMNLLQIGELAGRLSEEYRKATAGQMPWQQMKSMRNIFAHNYINIKIDEVWNTAEHHVPPLLEFCTEQLAESSLQAEVLSSFQNPDEIDL